MGGTVMDLFKFFTKDEVNSKDIARERLKMVLAQDRTSISPQILNMLKANIIELVSGYMEIDEGGVQVQLTRNTSGHRGATSELVANIPIRKVKNIGKTM
jgi:cell division topological specificity factor